MGRRSRYGRSCLYTTNPVFLDLIHRHLPLLSDAGLIEYNQEHETVSIEVLDPLITDLIRWGVDSDQASGL